MLTGSFLGFPELRLGLKPIQHCCHAHYAAVLKRYLCTVMTCFCVARQTHNLSWNVTKGDDANEHETQRLTTLEGGTNLECERRSGPNVADVCPMTCPACTAYNEHNEHNEHNDEHDEQRDQMRPNGHWHGHGYGHGHGHKHKY